MRRCTVLLCVMCLALGACRSRDGASLEAQFEKEKPSLTKLDLDIREDSCRGVGATAFMRGSDIVMIEYAIGTSMRWWILDFYYDAGQLRLVVQRTWWLLDDQAYELEKPRLESETRFRFEDGRLTGTEGDDPPVETTADHLLGRSTRLARLAGTENGDIPHFRE